MINSFNENRQNHYHHISNEVKSKFNPVSTNRKILVQPTHTLTNSSQKLNISEKNKLLLMMIVITQA